jgi:hypothetical protein
MSTHCIKQPNGVCNCSRPPCGNIVIFSHPDIMAYFVDAIDRGEPADSSISGYVWDEATSKLHAIISNWTTGVLSEYAMDIETRKPVWVRAIRTEQVRHMRRRKFGSAMWRATKAWQDR